MNDIPAPALTIIMGWNATDLCAVTMDMAVRVSATQPVVYVTDSGPQELQNRVRAVSRRHAVKASKLYTVLQPMELRNTDRIVITPFTLRESANVKDFGTLFKQLQPALVVLEPGCLQGLNKRSTLDTGIVINACARLRGITGAAVMLVWDTLVADFDESGARALFEASDCVMSVTREHDELSVNYVPMGDNESLAAYSIPAP